MTSETAPTSTRRLLLIAEPQKGSASLHPTKSLVKLRVPCHCDLTY